MNYKEIFIKYDFNYYSIPYSKDLITIQKYMKENDLIENLSKIYYENEFVKIQKINRIILILKIILASLLGLKIIFLTISYFNISFSFLSKSIISIIFSIFFIIITIFLIIIAILNIFTINKHKIILKNKLNDLIEESFPTLNFYVKLNNNLNIFLRIIEYYEEKIKYEDMDIFDFLNYHNPEQEEFYEKSDPFESDPYNKNYTNEFIKEHELKLLWKVNEKQKIE